MKPRVHYQGNSMYTTPPVDVLPEDRPLTILVVEDDDIFAQCMTEMLGKLDFKTSVTRVDTMNNALSKLISGRFDVVLLDLKLPDGDGLDIMERIIHAPLAPPAVIVMTSSSPESRLYEALARGAQEFANKTDLASRGIGYLVALIMRALYRQYGFRVKYLSLARFISIGTKEEPQSHA